VKTKSKYILLTLIAVALTAGAVWFLQKLLIPKYQKGVIEGSMIEEYYESDEPHEVIFLGDCEVYENISTVTLYENYGISSYIRGSAQQLTWQSYYLLEDTLRYETPKVVVFNVLALIYDEPRSESYNRMTLDGMRWSGVKYEAVKASLTEDETVVSYMFPILRYHSRWNELTSTDFEYIFDRDRVTANGYYMRVDVRAEADFPDPTPLADYTLPDKSMTYLTKLAELCKREGIELVLIKAPTLYPYWYDEWDEQVQDFADEYDLDYINYIDFRDEMGLDMTTDTYDAGLHLNLYGAEKFADYIGQYLVSNYNLTDFRQNPEVDNSWQETIEFYNELRDAQLQELEEYGELQSWGANAIE